MIGRKSAARAIRHAGVAEENSCLDAGFLSDGRCRQRVEHPPERLFSRLMLYQTGMLLDPGVRGDLQARCSRAGW